MKVQLQQQTLRLRISEHELAQLLAGGEVSNLTRITPSVAYSFNLCLTKEVEPTLVGSSGCWWFHLPQRPLQDYVATLPNRHGLEFPINVGQNETLQVEIEVDVRDSVRSRGGKKRD
jgi:hypothetical protein